MAFAIKVNGVYMSKFKKNNKKSKNNKRNSYKIESLEPRLLMDATASQWNDEIGNMTLSAHSIAALDDANFFKESNWSQEGVVSGLRQVSGSDESTQVDEVSKADFMKLVGSKLSKKATESNEKLEAVKDVLKEAVRRANGNVDPSVDEDGNPVDDNILSAEDVYNGFVALYGREIYEQGKLSIGLNHKDGRLAVFSSVFFDGSISPNDLSAYKADISDCFNIGSDFDIAGINQHVEFTFGLDGDKLTGNQLVAARYASAVFNEKKDAETSFGVIDLKADQDDAVDLYIGTSLRVDNSTSVIDYRDGLIADFNFELINSNGSLANVLPGGLHLSKAGLSDSENWAGPDGSNYTVTMENLGKITMGRILGKLQKLSAKISEVQKGGSPGEFDFGGILASDSHTLMNLSVMIDSILSQSPQSLQELADCFNKSKFKIDENAKLIYSLVNNELKMHFDFLINGDNAAYIDSQNKNSTNVFKVAVSADNLKSEMNIDVVQNDYVDVVSNVALGFDLVVPLENLTKVASDTKLYNVGIGKEQGKELGGQIIAGTLIRHNSWPIATITDCTSVAETKLELDGNNSYTNRVVYYKDLATSSILTDDEIAAFRSVSGNIFDDVSPVYGYVVDVSSITKLTYESKEYKSSSIATILNTIFSTNDNSKMLRVEEFDNKTVVVYAPKNVSPVVNAYNDVLSKISGISFGPLKSIWISKDATQTITAASDVTLKVEGKEIVIDAESLANVSSVVELSTLLQALIDETYGWDEKSREIFVETYNDALIFKSKTQIEIEFTGAAAASDAALFGLGVDTSNKIQSNIGYCMVIELSKNGSLPVSCYVNLDSFATDSVSEVAVYKIMDKIAEQCNDVLNLADVVWFDRVDCCLKIKDNTEGVAFVSVTNMPGYALATLLGLTIDEQQKNICSLESWLKVDPNDASFEGLKLDIANVIQGKTAVNVLGNYGPYEVLISGDLGEAQIYTSYNIVDDDDNPGEWKLAVDPTHSDCVGGDKVFTVTTPSITIERHKDQDASGEIIKDEVIAELSLLNLPGRFVRQKTWTLVTDADLDTMKKYGPHIDGAAAEYPGFSIDTICGKLQDVVSKDLMESFYSKDAAKTFLESLNLPFQGKSIIDIMGLRSKINEMAKCLEQGNCNTLQELKTYFKQELGVDLKYTLSANGLGVDIEWRSFAFNQVTELGGMDFGIRGFNLGGSLEAYLNFDLTLKAHIDIVYDSAATDGDRYKATLNSDVNQLNISGYVWLSSGNIVTDMNVCVYEGEGDVSRQKLFQIGDDAENNHSHLYMLANVGLATWTIGGVKQSVAIRVGGTLHTLRYGIPSGDIKIGVSNKSVSKTAVNENLVYSQWNNDGANDNDNLIIWCAEGVDLNSVAAWKGEDGTRTMSADVMPTKSLVIDLTGLKSDLEAIELYDKLRQVADGLSDTVRRAQSALNRELLKKTMRNIPLVGDSVVSAADCLTGLYSQFVEPFRKYVYNATGLNARAVAEKLYMMLNSLFPTDNADKLQIVSESAPEYWAGKRFDSYYKGIQYMSSDDEACWRIRLHGVCVLDANGNFDLGYPGLGLKSEGGVKITLEWTLDIGFGISKNDGAFLLLSNGHEVDEKDIDEDSVALAQNTAEQQKVANETKTVFHAGDDLKIKLTIEPDAVLKGSLGFLAMNGQLTSSSLLTLLLGIDLNDGNNSGEASLDDWTSDMDAKRAINFSGLKSGISVEASLRGDMVLNVDMTLGIGGYTKTAPHIDTKLNVKWESDVGGGFGGLQRIAFDDIVLDAGSFLQNTVGDVVKKIQQTLKPIQPLIDFLQAEIPVLNKLPAGGFHITVLDLIKKYGDRKGMNFGFLDDIIELNNVIKKFGQFFSKEGIYIGEWVLYDATRGFAEAELNDAGMRYLDGNVNDVGQFVIDNYSKFISGGPQFVRRMMEIPDTITDFSDYIQNHTSYEWNTSSTSTFTSSSKISGSWEFPLFNKNTAGRQIMSLLMGGHADLVKFDLAPLEFNFDWRKSFPIVGPLCADIGFNFGVCIDLCFGYDTYGIAGWVKSGYKDYGCLVNGFYIDDLKDGKDVAEVVFHSGVVAGASVAGRAGINVGLNFNVNMDFIDPNYDGKIRLNELADMLSLNPLDMFNVSASIEARAFAYLDLFLYRKEWTLWSSGAIELFTTASKTTNRNPVLCSVQDDGVYVNVGEFASNRANGNILDGDETVVITITDTNTVNIAYGGISQDVTVSGKPLYIFAGEGNDRVTIKSMKKADDTLVEGNFNIVIDGGNGNDCIDMSEATLADNCFAVIMGGAGSDIIMGVKGINKSVIFGDSGYVAYVRDDDKKVVTGVSGAISYPEEEGAGTNLIYGGDSRNVIFGGFGLDVIVGGTKDDYILGDGGRFSYAGNDVVVDGHDLYDEGGNDVIYGMSGNDRIYGGGGNDSIDAGLGDDVVYAGQGHDVVYGGSGNDELHGDDGVDVIFGDTPKDKSMLIADAGDKAAAGVLPYNYISREIKNNESSLYEGDFEKNTSMPEMGKTESSSQTDNGAIKLYDFLSRKKTNVDYHALEGLKGLLNFWIRQEHPEYDATQLETAVAKALKINGQAGAETNSGYNDTIFGDNGSDIIFGDDGANDKNGSDVIEGGAGNDFINGDAGDDKISGDSGDDIIYGGDGNDYLDGGANNDIVMGDDGWAGYNLLSEDKLDHKWFGTSDSEKIFGDMVKSFSLNYNIDQFTGVKATASVGKDTIITGNGNDIVDGQGGDDTYLVNFMGGYYSAYTNILESGLDAADSMVVNGTVDNDDVLIRASDVDLGMIALLPDSVDETRSPDKKRLERINYWNLDGLNRGVECISINTGAGDDRVTLDSSISSVSVDMGAGDDIVNVGQMFDTTRKSNDVNKINGVDSFKDSTILTTQGYVSAGAKYASSFIGGDGDDVFNVLHTDAAISLSGNAGDDRFNIGSFIGITPNSTTYQVKNGPVTVIGGVGDDSMSINGTEGDDTFVFTEGTVISPNVDVQAVGVENQDVCGGDGDDSFYVLDTPKGSVYSIKGNNGNDSFYNGGAMFADGVEKSIDISGGRDEDASASENIDVVLCDEDGNVLNSPEGEMKEGDGSFKYSIKLSRALGESESVTITVFVPVVSSENTTRGDRGIFFLDHGEYKTSLTLTFDKDHVMFSVEVVAFADSLREGNDYFAILHNVSTDNSLTVNPCRNMMVFLRDSMESTAVFSALTTNKEYIIRGTEDHKFFVGLDSLPKQKDISVWAEGLDVDFTSEINGNQLTVSWDKSIDIPAGTRIFINYSSTYLLIDNQSVVQMKYSADSIVGERSIALYTEYYQLKGDSNDSFLTYSSTDNKKVKVYYVNSSETSDILNQEGYMYCYLKQSVSMGDTSITLPHGVFGAPVVEYYYAVGTPPMELYAGQDYSLSAQGKVLTLKDENGFAANGFVVYRSAIYFGKASANRTSVVLKLDDAVEFFNNDDHPVELQFHDTKRISDGKEAAKTSETEYYYKKTGNQIIIYNTETDKPISVSGALDIGWTSAKIHDDVKTENPLAKYKDKVPVDTNSIEGILGTVLEDGAGEFNDFATSPIMLRYGKTDGRNETDLPDTKDEISQKELQQIKDVNAKREADFDEKKSVDRVFMHNMDSNLAATSSLGSLDANKVEETEDSTKDEKKLITAETALLKSDAESLQLRHQASGSDVNKNISFGNMEYGEINLGTGEDTVDVNKSIYREDGFQTFTVVNSGKGGDTINVNSYKDGSDDQLVINAGEGDDHILATDAENVTKSGLIAFGGLGNDKIEIKSESSLVFGDRGQVLYHDADGNVVTRLGDNKTGTFIGKENGVARNAGGSDYATGKKKGDEAYYQTDGTRYGATIARTVTEDQGGNDQIALADGNNVVFGGTNDPAAVDKDNEPIVESVTTGNGEDLVFGDNGYTTFQGRSDVAKKLGMDNMPTIYSEATLSFNFQGPAQTGIAANEQAGAVADYTVKNVDETTGETVETAKHVEHHVGNWNNIKGHEAGTYGDNDDEIVLFDNGTRASAVSVSYGASEDHRVNTTDGDNIRLHGYTQEGRISANNSGDYNLMKSGLDTSGNNARNTLLAQVDGLDQYFTDYDVIVYLDMVQENSWAGNSVRVVTLYRDIVENGVARSEWVKSYYVNDPESNSFNGKWVVSTATTAEQARNAKDGEGNPEYANCVIFEGVTGDRFHVEITDGDAWNGYNNGKDRAGIAGIQVCGRLHRQDVAASTDITHGGNDVINTQGGDDIVVGGTGADTIRTFGDDRYGIYDNDVVFGDNAKLSFTDRDGNLDTASTISYAESIASQNMSVSYDDKIMTGDGNDVVVGGSGSDKIDSGATAQADEKLDGLEVFSLNFTDVSSNQSTLISKGEAAGVVTDNDWHNAYLYNGDPRVHGTDSLGGIGFSYDCYGNTNAPTEVTNAKMDADTGNNKMMMNYVGGHNQDPLTVRLNNIRSKITAAKYDVYVYIDGINNDSDAHGYVFKITGSNGKAYYLNDWSGNRFDGDFKQVTCTDYTIGSLKDGITPSVEMIGNYVVFRDVESPNFDVTIECVDSNFGTQERNDLPVVSAVQIVAGVNREKNVAVGGDHDKDFVAGDDASLHFDLDIPFAGDENIRDYQNRLISAKSMPVSGSANNDKIWTGKDRDVVVGGEGNDQIDAGAGDDVVIGNTARNLYVEHNNPVGVFRPNVNIVLEDNDYNVAEPRPYLDGQGGNRDQIRSMVQNGQIEGISLDYQNMANDTVYGGYNNKDLVFNGNVTDGEFANDWNGEEFFGVQNDEVHSLPVPSAPAENPVSGDEEPTGTDQPIGCGDESQTGGESGNGGVRTVVSSMAFANLDLEANERVKVVFEDYPKFADHIANLHLYFAGMPGEMFENVCVELYSHGRLYRYDVPGGYWFGVDVQDHIDADPALGDGNCVVYISSELATSFTVTIGE